MDFFGAFAGECMGDLEGGREEINLAGHFFLGSAKSPIFIIIQPDLPPMKKALLLLLLLPLFGFSQSRPNSDIIQTVIQNRLEKFSETEKLPNSIVMLNGLTNKSRELAVNGLCLSLNRLDQIGKNMKKPSLLKTEEMLFLIIKLCKSIHGGESLDVEGYNTLPGLSVVKRDKIEILFNSNDANKNDAAWNTFYKIYPEGLGFMEFSNVVYSKNWSLVYVTHRHKPIGGIGYVAILKKIENGYVVEDAFNLWMY
ncbi:hypothetical protein [Mariniradius saccharolyticus]|uniref:hypothetical protein n=1 Tax=Mariniradius saccharolyticus TaxID=1245591 RepID=UPI0012F6FCC6|nr:hypothetical protein [Mariniradius saccharolyticus]